MMFKELLDEHLIRYPEMETIDQIKLAYQAVYGPYHLHKSDYLNYLMNEECNESEYIEYPNSLCISLWQFEQTKMHFNASALYSFHDIVFPEPNLNSFSSGFS